MFRVIDNNIRYIIPPHGVTVTFHVPAPCRNKCQFCGIGNKYYSDDIKPDTEAIMQVAEKLAFEDFVGSFVISGGEPLDEDYFTVRLAEKLYEGTRRSKPTYINTQLPVDKWFNFISAWNSDFGNRCFKRYIDGISVSRHAAKNDDELFTIEGVPDYFIKQYAEEIPIRINCVLNDKTDIVGVVNRWKDANVTVSFRRNYFNTNEADLYEIDKAFRAKFGEVGFVGDVDLKSDNAHYYAALITEKPTRAKFQYYACLENTCLIHRFVNDTNVYELHDIVVLPDGRAFDDWNIDTAHQLEF